MRTEDKRIRWHLLTPTDACRIAGTDLTRGLSEKEAVKRLRTQGVNRFMQPQKEIGGILRSLLRDPILILTLFCGVLSVCFGEFLSGVPFLVLCIAWGTAFAVCLFRKIALLQKEFSFFETPTVTVVRDGEAFYVPSTRIVRGDILVFHAGDIVPCDCRLLTGDELTVRMTWREDEKPTPHLYRKNPYKKYEYGDQTTAPDIENMLYGGSIIASGSAIGVTVERNETSFLGAMGEKFASGQHKTVGRIEDGIRPYCKLLSFVSLLLLFLVGIVSLFVSPKEYTSLRVFLPVCVMTASASVGVTWLYFKTILSENRFFSARKERGQNRAWIRSDTANETLPYLTDLFIIGKEPFSDGKLHFDSTCTGNGIDTTGENLSELTEAFVLLAKVRESLSIAKCERFTEIEDMTYLGELLKLTKFDLHALDIRLQNVGMVATGDTDTISVTTNRENYRLHFSHGGGAIQNCTDYLTANGIFSMTPQTANIFLRYETEEKEKFRTVLTVVKEINGRMIFVGMLSCSEAFLPNLSDRVESLCRMGINVTAFSDLSADDSQRYFGNAFQNVTVSDFSDFELNCNQSGFHIYTFDSANISQIADRMRAMRKEGKTVALLCNRIDNRKLLDSASLRIVSDDCFGNFLEKNALSQNRIPIGKLQHPDSCLQSVRDSADILVSRAGACGGGIGTIEPILKKSRQTTFRIRALLWNLTLLKLSRLVFFTLCTLSGLGPPTATETFLIFFGGDLLAMFMAMKGKIRKNSDALFSPDYDTLTAFFRNRAMWLSATVPPVVTWFFITVLRAVGFLSGESAQALPLIGLAVFQTVLLIFAESADVRVGDAKEYAKIVAILIGPIIPMITLSVWIKSVGSVTGLGTWSPATAVAIVLCVSSALFGTLLCIKDRSK